MATVCFANPNNCFKKPKVVDWDGKKFFLCERTACCVSEGVSFMDDNGMYVGLFANAKLADETKVASEKYKDKPLKRVVLQANGYTAPKKNTNGKGEGAVPKPPKPVFYAFMVKKAGKAKFDTEYLGKCTDIMGTIAHARNDTQPTGVYDLKLKLTLADPDYGTSLVVSKTANDPFVVITSKPTPGGQYGLAESMEESKKLRNHVTAVDTDVSGDVAVKKHIKKRAKSEDVTDDVTLSLKKSPKRVKQAKSEEAQTPPL